jgi:predicted signal transduction protein with EAL and GGDEF domain
VRLGGDELAVLLTNTDPASATGVAQRLLDGLTEPFDLEGVALQVDASIGLALCPDHADTTTTLLQRADVAMYQAKASNNGWQAYPFVGEDQACDRLQTIEDLRAALDRDELLLHYQPKIDPRTRQVVGVETLVRWIHPAHGLLYPDTFLPLAEQTGLMRQLTLVVLQTALRQGQAWRHAGLDLPVAVNLWVANLLDAHLAGQVGDLLAGLGLPPRALELELTEDTLMADPVRSKQVLADLRALGLRLSVDDCCSGPPASPTRAAPCRSCWISSPANRRARTPDLAFPASARRAGPHAAATGPGRPLRRRRPRSANVKPPPATRSLTVREHRISPAPACYSTRAAMCTAIPQMSSPGNSTRLAVGMRSAM